MTSRKTVVAFIVFYGVLIAALGGFAVLKYGYFLGNLAPGESRVFQASVFVNKISGGNTVYFPAPGANPAQWRPAGPGDKLKIKIETVRNFGFFIEYSRQPRITFDYRITADPDAKPGRYLFKIVFESGFEYQDSVIVKRKPPFFF